ncbi:MAGUK p55 subfamily member 7 isoform X2 [Planococcus citri]|uniref:MAGUK p55 subfamily member 7 isoform X2 n=1 Tax=Planococcus citri TaxID=170843 RepID=UPI0031F9E343
MTTAVMASRNWDPSLSGLLASLEESRGNVCTSDEEFNFLSNMLHSKELHALFKVHNKILEKERNERYRPVLASSMQIVLEIMDAIIPYLGESDDCKELFFHLQKPHLQGLLCSHDAVAQKDYYPRLPEIPQDVDEDEETVKIVQLVKSNEPLGATIKTDEETGKIVIARVMHGGAADRSGLIHVGDEVVEVNGICVEGKTPNDVLKILQSSEGTITFKLIPADGKYGLRESRVRVRAHFDYQAANDVHIPCKEAGLDFVRGDILHIVSKEDKYWWQARKEGDKNLRAGLIPSRLLQERRILLERANSENKGEKIITSCLKTPDSCLPEKVAPVIEEVTERVQMCTLLNRGEIGGSPRCIPKIKTKKIIYDTAENDDFDREEIPTYEEVVKLYPRPGMLRPLVLIGPPGIGRNELKRRLMITNPDKFKTPTPYTSRPPRTGEMHGKDYFFVSREKMEEEISDGKFIEFGEYKGNLYGTSAETVKTLISEGSFCVLTPHYQALKMLRTSDVKPYVVFIKPPEFDALKETRNAAFARSTFDESNSRGFTDEEFNEIIRSSRRIEFLYGHWFDETIVNADLPTAFEQLLQVVYKIENEPLWVPATWVQ